MIKIVSTPSSSAELCLGPSPVIPLVTWKLSVGYGVCRHECVLMMKAGTAPLWCLQNPGLVVPRRSKRVIFLVRSVQGTVSVSSQSLPELPYRPCWSQGCGKTGHTDVYKEQQRKDTGPPLRKVSRTPSYEAWCPYACN